MQEPHSQTATAVQLLDELEAQVTRSSELEREWQAAFEEFPQRGDSGALLRFREWFLLERPAECLGSSPVQAWAPPDLEEGSAWFRLLDNVFGIFRVEQKDGSVLLEDLWSGQALLWKPEQALPALGPEALAVGRFVLGEGGWHEPLPGVFLIAAEGLIDALERDLNALRVENPRGRLSQRECELLFQSWMGEPEAEASPAPDPEASRARLADLLRDQPGWDLDRAEGLLAAGGQSALLDELAFDSGVDLEQARRLILELAAAWTEASPDPGAVSPHPGGPVPEGSDPSDLAGELEPGEAEQALRRFDEARATGKPVEESFRQLESDLGLAAGSSEEQADPEPVGPVQRTGLGDLVEVYRWERQAGGTALGPEEETALAALANLVEALASEDQSSCVLPGQVVAFLLQARDEDLCRAQIDQLDPFLRWAAREQDEPVAELVDQMASGLGEVLGAAVRFNQERAQAGAMSNSHAKVAATEPVRVQVAEGELAPVADLPETSGPGPRVGDLLGGHWHEGHFEAAMWLPREALAALPSQEA